MELPGLDGPEGPADVRVRVSVSETDVGIRHPRAGQHGHGAQRVADRGNPRSARLLDEPAPQPRILLRRALRRPGAVLVPGRICDDRDAGRAAPAAGMAVPGP